MSELKDHDLLIRIDENVKCLPIIQEDIKRINGTLIQTKTRLEYHEKDTGMHSKIDVNSEDIGLFGKALKWLIKIVFKM